MSKFIYYNYSLLLFEFEKLCGWLFNGELNNHKEKENLQWCFELKPVDKMNFQIYVVKFTYAT